MKQNRNVSYLNQNKTKLNYVIKFSLIECSLFITKIVGKSARDNPEGYCGFEITVL